MDHWAERRGGRRVADAHRDRLGDRVRLLSREPAMLDREARRVAGGEDVVAVAHAPVLVNRDEARVVVGEPGDPRADDLSEGDDDVGTHQPAAAQPETAFGRSLRHGSRHDLDVVMLEGGADGVGRVGAKRLERLRLSRDDGDARIGDVAFAQEGGAHQRQLVERERPCCAGGRREDQTKLRIARPRDRARPRPHRH